MGVLKAKINGVWTPITQGYSSAQVGYVAQAIASSATSGIGASVTDVGASVTFTAIPGHVYKVSVVSGRMDQTTASAGAFMGIYDGANNFKAGNYIGLASGEFGNINVFVVESGLSGSVTRKARANTQTGTVTVQAGTLLLVEDITNVQPYDQPVIEAASYTPTLTSMVVGASGSNVADYIFYGLPGIGGKGILNLQGRIAFGSSGQTFPTGASRIALPPGFNLANTLTVWHVGHVRASISGVYDGVMATEQSNAASLQVMFSSITAATAGTPTTMSSPTATFPSTWANLSEIRWQASLMAVRV